MRVEAVFRDTRGSFCTAQIDKKNIVSWVKYFLDEKEGFNLEVRFYDE